MPKSNDLDIKQDMKNVERLNIQNNPKLQYTSEILLKPDPRYDY